MVKITVSVPLTILSLASLMSAATSAGAQSAAPIPPTAIYELLPPTFGAMTTPTGGDGFIPILHTTADGTPEIWNIYHHQRAQIVCTNRLTASRCEGWSGARYLFASATPFLTFVPYGQSVVTTVRADATVQDPSNAAVIWMTSLIADGTTGKFTVDELCINLDTQSTCGATPLTPVSEGADTSVINRTAEPQLVGSKIYTPFFAGHAMLCYDLSTSSPCAGQPYPIPLTAGYAITPAHDGRIYGSDADIANGVLRAWCFDTATNAPCRAWPIAVDQASTEPFAGDGIELYTYDASGNVSGVCVGWSRAGGAFHLGCSDLNGNGVDVPPGFPLPNPQLTQGGLVSSFEGLAITAPNGHAVTFMPLLVSSAATFAQVVNGGTLCYDWTTSSPCAPSNTGIPGFVRYPTVNGGATKDYGYAYDGQCVFGLGDAGWLWTFDPLTGDSPCRKTQTTVAIDPAAFYCDGRSGHVQSYATVSLRDMDLSTVQFPSSKVVVKDPSGAVLATFPVDPATGSADISSIPVRPGGIQVVFDIGLINDSAFTSTTRPKALVAFSGDTPQLCLTSPPPGPATVGQPYSHTFTSSFGFPPPTFTVSSGSLPPGLSLSPAGVLSGTPTARGIYGPIEVCATNGSATPGCQTFTLSVSGPDAVPPVLNVPSGVTATSTGSSGGAVVTYNVTATDDDPLHPSATVVCAPPSGSTFPIGTTTVSCTATDFWGNTATSTFTVTVQDVLPPVVSVPSPITVPPSGPSGAVVTYTASAHDDDARNPSPAVTCTPPSGSTFPIGVTTVTCNATDASGNTGTSTFTVTVGSPLDLFAELIRRSQGVGPGQAVLSKALRARDQYQAGDVASSCKSLDDYIKQVRQHTPALITPTVANGLIDLANLIKTVLAC
jgi:hypothetical protein